MIKKAAGRLARLKKTILITVGVIAGLAVVGGIIAGVAMTQTSNKIKYKKTLFFFLIQFLY